MDKTDSLNPKPEIVDLTDPWQRLSTVLQTATDVKQSFSLLIEPSIKGWKVCSLGYGRKAAGESPWDIMNPAIRMSSLYGFSKEDRTKLRRCPEIDCNFCGRLSSVIAHLNDHHRFSIPMVGKLIMSIKNDTREIPSLKEISFSKIKSIFK